MGSAFARMAGLTDQSPQLSSSPKSNLKKDKENIEVDKIYHCIDKQ
jgi:hypothetical protein